MVVERFATYAGADPRRAPAALAVAGYVEHAFGAWHPRGGMYEVVRALVRRFDGELRLNEPVERILVSNGRVRGVSTASGAFAADAVVAAIDEAAVRPLAGLPVRPREPSLAGSALLLGVRGDADTHHRILFPADYDAEFDDIFVHHRAPRDPTIYISVPSVTNTTG
jgi:phytoene dehydrogenase-like protein